MLGVTGRRPRRVLFVGGGPLPLTSLLLASRHGHTAIDSIDVEPEAIQLAARLAHVLEVGAVCFRCADVLDCTDIAGYDMVCLAAMVGPQPEEKRRVIEHLYQHMRAGALLLARSARLLRTLLYPPLTLSDLAGFRLLAVLNPYTEVVNSLVVAEKPGAPPPPSGQANAEELESQP